MNYNPWIFWIRFAAVYVPYWRLGHRKQNALLLVASYIFYGFWDYRFLFLILISTVIDFIGGLGVAGTRLTPTRLVRLGLLIIGSSVLLCTSQRAGWPIALWTSWERTRSPTSEATSAPAEWGRRGMAGRLAWAARPCCCATRAPRPAAFDGGVGASGITT